MIAKRIAFAGLLATALIGAGCQGLSNTAKGGLIGGGLGAGLGAAAGGGKGALIGGLAGTAIGGIVGNDMDQEEKREKDTRLAVAEARAAAATAPPPPAASSAVGMGEVIQWTREGMAENVIINHIRSTNSTFQLSSEDLRLLTHNQVSPRVIEEMQLRRPVTRVIQEPTRVIYEQPRYIYHRPPPPVYVYPPYYYGPPPPPRPYVGVGFYTR